ncbi:MAG: TetR/AcrR family transcriptional regulator [Acidimicrobiales bacterium]
MPDGNSSDAATEVRRRSDGEATHAAILEEAMRLASIEGLGSLTIGRLARESGVSKSGLFAHFRSKQRLQQETIGAAEAVFAREVVEPGLDADEGLAQLEGVCEAYLSYVERGVFPGGCFFAQLLAEFDAPEGTIHEAVVVGQRGWIGMLEGLIVTAQQRGELDAEVDPGQLAFELYAALELANYLSTLYRDPTVVDQGRVAVRSAIARATSNPRQTSMTASVGSSTWRSSGSEETTA